MIEIIRWGRDLSWKNSNLQVNAQLKLRAWQMNIHRIHATCKSSSCSTPMGQLPLTMFSWKEAFSFLFQSLNWISPGLMDKLLLVKFSTINQWRELSWILFKKEKSNHIQHLGVFYMWKGTWAVYYPILVVGLHEGHGPRNQRSKTPLDGPYFYIQLRLDQSLKVDFSS